MTIKTKKKPQNNNLIIGAIAIAVVVAIIFIGLSVSGITQTNYNIDYSKIPVTRTSDGGFVAGNPNAPVTIVAFEDFLCSHCHEYEPTLQQFIKEYVETGKAKFEYRMMPTASGDYYITFQLAECSEIVKPGSFFLARQTLFGMAGKGWDRASSPREFASTMGLDYSKVLDCMKTTTQLSVDVALSQSAQIGGTPTILARNADGQLFSPGGWGTQPTFDKLSAYVIASSLQ